MPFSDDGDLAASQPVSGMRVLVGDAAVRGPARVADAGVGGSRSADRLLELPEVPDRADVVGPGVLQEADAGRVVAAVLEALEPGKDQGLGLPGRRIR